MAHVAAPNLRVKSAEAELNRLAEEMHQASIECHHFGASHKIYSRAFEAYKRAKVRRYLAQYGLGGPQFTDGIPQKWIDQEYAAERARIRDARRAEAELLRDLQRDIG